MVWKKIFMMLGAVRNILLIIKRTNKNGQCLKTMSVMNHW